MKTLSRCSFKSLKKTGQLKSLFYLSLLLIGSVSNAFAANDDFSISEAQPTRVTHQESGDQTRISFSAFGQTFNLLLQENRPLMKRYRSRLLDIELYAGTIEGVDNSWARISLVNGEYSGAVFNGFELFMLDTGEMLADAVESIPTETMLETSNVVYRASDLTTTSTCAIHGEDQVRQNFSYNDLVSELQSQRAAAQEFDSNSDAISAEATATQQINLSIVADTQYVATSPNGAEAQVLSQMNIVDGIFSEQVGVQFGIEEIRVLSNNGPLTSSNASTLLNQYRNFIGNDNPGLSHLFTGREIDGNTIGIAFLSAICTVNGVGVTQGGGRGTTGALTAAHEFGHNFGAPHDNQAGSACASTPGNFLMNPSINGSDQFSQCSLQQMQGVLNTRSCLVDIEEPDPTPVANCNGQVNFASGTNGYSFINDPQTPAYTSSSVSGGALNVAVGGVDNADITNMEGAWQQQCESSSSGNVTISVNGSLTQANSYEANEFSQVLLRVNGNETVLATVTGDGNGGPTISTGVQEFTVDTTLSAGANTIELVCFNNLKTFNNEVSNCSFTSIEIADAVPDDILDTDFNSDFGGFSFVDDNSDPAYSDGSRTSNGGVDNSGGLVVTLGGVDNADINNMEASWTRGFTTPQSGQFILSLDANLVQAPDYEANESSEVGIMINGQSLTLNQVAGNGNGGGNVSTGFQSYNVSFTVGAGNHTVSLFCRNSAKTFNNEETECTFDNVVIQ